MKIKIYYFFPIIAVLLLTAFGNPHSPKNPEHSSGAPAGYTGSPGDGKNCTQCHGGTATTQAGIITSNIPSQGYTAGSSYTITVTVTGSGNKGFEVSPQNPSGTLLGTLTAGSGNHLTGSNSQDCTHSSPISGSPAIWNFTWTAPSAGTGTVTFYGAFAITQSTTKLSTLVVNENPGGTFSINATAIPGSICSGQSSQLNVTATGGSGVYTYSWTSIPSGFTSNIQNPVVFPTQTTQYVAQVGDGSQTITDTTQVNVTTPPTASAGNDTTYCKIVTQIPLHGTATGYSTITWTTSGDGTFSSINSLISIYYPGSGDENNGSVHLTLTASPAAPCTNAAASTRIILFDPCGVGILVLDNSPFTFSIRPNPSNGIFNIYSASVKTEDVRIRIIDFSGKLVMIKEFLNNGDNLVYGMDISNLPKGIYFISIQTKNGVKTEKLILE
jgi:hypothetical protein